MEVQGFELNGTYYDNEKFPLGFRRSGDFTIAESDILHAYGKTLAALESGQLAAGNPEQKHFVAVCRGEKEVSSALERTWLKYRSLRFRGLPASAFGRSKPERGQDVMEFVEEPEDDI